jgi:hypothetical protein
MYPVGLKLLHKIALPSGLHYAVRVYIAETIITFV